MTRRRKIIIGSAVALVILVLLPVRAHYRAKAALAAYKQQLQSQGEKLTIEELIPPTPTSGPNGAMAFSVAANRLPDLDNRIRPLGMKYFSPGRALVGWKQQTFPIPFENTEFTNPWPQLRLELEANRESMNEIKIALMNPVIDFNLDYRQGFILPLSHLSSVFRALRWFAPATLLELHEGHTDAAWENLRAMMAITHCLDNEPLYRSQSVRNSALGMAFTSTWETLQFPGWKDEQLAELQAAWVAARPPQSLSACLAMERGFAVDMYEHFRGEPELISLYVMMGDDYGSTTSSEMEPKFVKDLKGKLHDFADEFHHRFIWPLWTSHEDELWYLQSVQAILTGARWAEKNYAFAPALKSINQNLAQLGPAGQRFCVARDWLPRLFPYLTERFAQTETRRQLIVAAIALKRHQLRHGKYPAELSALVPEFLPTVPLDFMDGKPLRYRPLPDGQFLLYSVGTDGEDNGGEGNGGDASPTHDEPLNRTLWKARDWVWPLPASSAEIEADNAAQRQKKPG